MATPRFKMNSRTLQQYLDGQHGTEALLDAEADRILSAAQSAAPVESGDYSASLHVETGHTDRMVKQVVADVDYAMMVEAKHGTLGKALG